MNEKKTLLQIIMENENKRIRKAIEKAINDGAKVEHSTYVRNGYTIDGIFVQKYQIDNITICLDMKSEIISQACEPSKDELEKMAERKRAELEEIEKQINAKQ